METESTNTKKIIIAVVLVALVAFAIYFFAFRSSDTEITFDEFGNPVQAQVVGQDLLDLLSELQSVSLNAAIFNSQLFRNLNDFGIELRDEPRGRTDPFEPIGGSVSTQTSR